MVLYPPLHGLLHTRVQQPYTVLPLYPTISRAAPLVGATHDAAISQPANQVEMSHIGG